MPAKPHVMGEIQKHHKADDLADASRSTYKRRGCKSRGVHQHQGLEECRRQEDCKAHQGHYNINGVSQERKYPTDHGCLPSFGSEATTDTVAPAGVEAAIMSSLCPELALLCIQ